MTDHQTGLMWAKYHKLDPSESIVDWETALDWADTSELAGYSDWRAPY